MNKAAYQNRLKSEVASKNQQRCLNSEPFSRNRAYLNKQKRGKRIIELKLHQQDYQQKQKQPQLYPLNSSSNLSGNEESELNFSDLHLKLSKVHEIIFKLEEQKKKNRFQEKRPKSSQPKIANQKTRPDTIVTTHFHDDQIEYHSRLKSQESCHNKNVLHVKPIESPKRIQRKQSRSASKRMVKIKSNKNVLKVYNPFPVSYAQMI